MRSETEIREVLNEKRKERAICITHFKIGKTRKRKAYLKHLNIWITVLEYVLDDPILESRVKEQCN